MYRFALFIAIVFVIAPLQPITGGEKTAGEYSKEKRDKQPKNKRGFTVADNIWDNVGGGANDGNDPLNWSLGWVPKAGDTMVLDGGTTNANCTFSSTVSCDALRTDNAYSGTVTQGAHHVIYSGVAAIDFAWIVSNANYAIQAKDWQCGASCDISNGRVYVNAPGAGQGISVFTAGARIRGTFILWNTPGASGSVIEAGTYETKLLVQYGAGVNRSVIALAGTFQFDALELFTFSSGAVTFDLATNNPTVTITGDLTVDINSTGGVTLDASSNALTLQGDLIDEITGGGTFTADSQALTLTGTNNQAVAHCGGTFGAKIINKAAGTVSAQDAWTVASLTGTDGDLDLNSQTVTSAGACDFASGFTLADMDGTINCDTFSSDGQSLVGAGTWYLNATSSGTATGTTFTNCDASGGVEIDATNNCVDGGGNLNINFGVTATPSTFRGTFSPAFVGAFG